MKKTKTSELTGPALDWAVAKAEEWNLKEQWANDTKSLWFEKETPTGIFRKQMWELPYSTDWAQGGPIIERERITVGPADTSPFKAHYGPADSTFYTWKDRYMGPTPLVAAMRCYVVKVVGEQIEIPKELTPL